MRVLVCLLSLAVVVGLAHWAYRENYRTKLAWKHAEEIRAQIRAAHARLDVLQDEWAYQNRPARLRELAFLNFESLQLFDLGAEHFGELAAVPYRPDAPLELFTAERAGLSLREIRP